MVCPWMTGRRVSAESNEIAATWEESRRSIWNPHPLSGAFCDHYSNIWIDDPGVCRTWPRQTPNAKPAPGKSQENMIDMRIHPQFSSRSTSSAGFFRNCQPCLPTGRRFCF